MRKVLLSFAFIAAYPICAQTGSGGVLKVHVISGTTAAPVVGANVVLNGEQNETAWGRTNMEGEFTGTTQSAGVLLLTVSRNGYRMRSNGMGLPVEIKVGVETSVTVEMLSLGILAGRVVDQYGDPVRHAIVHTEDRMSLPGAGDFFQSYSAGTTDDLGEYRIAEVEPGKHYVVAEYSSADEARGLGTSSRFRWPQTGGLAIYPDATGMDQAQQLEVREGETLRVNDLRINIQRAVSVSGKIKPPPTDPNSISIERAAKLALHSSAMVQGEQSEPDGSFKINVLPGKYMITAADRKTGKTSKPLAIDVGDTGVIGLELNLTLGYEISGRVEVDGPERIDYAALTLNFGGQGMKIDPSGAFRTNLFSGQAGYNLQGLTGDFYIKSVRVAGKQIPGRQFEIEPGNTEVIVTLSPRGARLSFSAGASGVELPPMFVLLVPETGAIPDFESLPHAEPDPSGSLVTRGVPPGAWRVFALDASNWGLAMKPDVLLEKFRSQAPLITVTEGEQKKVVLPVMKIQMESF